ncbi:MAG: [LysW]-lysine hydrolase [Halolamina sp.]|uniref:[LysW]-lysine hydrolase n=1 Tax=Halolamina sp. TaxID=1940283 RepID=UPI002FC2DDB5
MSDARPAPDIEAPNGTLDTPGRRLLAELVSIPSPSGEEAPAASHLRSFFERNGRDAVLDAAGNVRAPADDSVLLTSHIDTVPGDLPVSVVEGDAALGADGPVLHGRGSVDATGSLAAMAVAAIETGVSFAGVVAEETDSAGARYLLADRSAPEAVVNGEPSGWNALTLGYRGLVSGRYTVESRAAHGARPEPNAIDHVTAWWERVREEVDGSDAETEPDGDEAGIFGTITARATEITGGLAADGESVEATLDVQFRVPPDESPLSVQESVETCLTHGSLTWSDAVPPHVADPRRSPAAALRSGIRGAGGEPTHLHKTGTADANLFADGWDVPVVSYGPGDSALDHAPDERLPLAEFDRAVAVLRTACEQLAN